MFENWPNDAAWGPNRIEYIRQMYNNGTLTNNDVYAATICKDASISPSTRLNEVLEEYKKAMKTLGYILT